MRRPVLALCALFVVVSAFSGPASAVIPGVGVISKKNMEWKWNNEKTVGSDIEFFERKQADGSVRRYAVAGDIGHGFDIYDITNPDMPTLAGVYVSPGLQWQGDVQVNPRRNIVSFATDNLGASLAHGGGIGIELVDITNIASPQRLGVVSNVGGAHNSTIINDQYIYTALPTHIIDYSDPRNPKNLGQVPFICGHDLTVDPNRPDRLYSACSSGNKWQIVDISDPATPKLIADVKDTQISIAHQADPAPDSSFVIVSDERGGGISHHRCPGGGGHVYDISGKYVAGASETTPKKMGVYFAPFTGTSSGGSSGQWANCTMHNFTFQAERFAFSVGWYSAGSFVADLQEATKTSGGLYQEYAGPDASVPGKTTWGNTLGNILLEGDEVWSTKWTRFDDPLYDRYLFTNGLTRGVDTLKYTGPLPLKVARLTVDGQAPGGVVSGVLDRYAVWTYEGWVNKPLAGKTLQITAGGTTVEATTGADGSFSAATGLLPGTYEVTVTWPGDQDYQPATVTRQITVS